MNNQTEYRTMTQKKSNRTPAEIKAMMAEDGEFLRPMVRAVIQEFLEVEMAEAVGLWRQFRGAYSPRRNPRVWCSASRRAHLQVGRDARYARKSLTH
jgi:transposase-like protein